MPLLKIVTSSEAPAHADALLQELSRVLARELGKPESYVMTCLEPRARMTFGGTTAPTCYVEIKNVGTFNADLTARLSDAITSRIARAFDVPADRVYIEFSDSRPHMWGHDGGTFA